MHESVQDNRRLLTIAGSLCAVYTVLQMADMATTLVALRDTGVTEENPLAASGAVGFFVTIVSKGLMCGVVWTVWYVAHSPERRWLTLPLCIGSLMGVAVLLFVLGNNAANILQAV